MVKTTPVLDPYLLRCRKHGLIIVLKENRKWTIVIAKTSTQVYIKRIRNAELEYDAQPFEYPGGVAAAAEKFLNPTLGIAEVTATAKRELENIVKTYTTRANAKRALSKIGDYALSKADEFIIKEAEDKYNLYDTAAEVYQYDCVTNGVEKANSRRNPSVNKKEIKKSTRQNTKIYTIIKTADFSKRRGGFRLTLDAVAAGKTTFTEIYEEVLKNGYRHKKADVYTDLSMAKKYGYITITQGE